MLKSLLKYLPVPSVKTFNDEKAAATQSLSLHVPDGYHAPVSACELLATPRRGQWLQTPWVGSAGALDMVNFSDRDSIPERYAHRQFVEHNAQVTLMRTTPEENYQLGVWIGNKLNLCEGPVRFIIPEGGFSALDAPGQPFFDPQARQAFAEGLESTLIQTAQRQIIKAPHHINAPEFCSLVIAQFQNVMQHPGTAHDSTPRNPL